MLHVQVTARKHLLHTHWYVCIVVEEMKGWGDGVKGIVLALYVPRPRPVRKRMGLVSTVCVCILIFQEIFMDSPLCLGMHALIVDTRPFLLRVGWV